MDLLYLLKENFKNSLFDLLITGKSFENLLFIKLFDITKLKTLENAPTHYEALNQTLLT